MPSRLTDALTDQRGFTLIEVMVATMLILVGLFGLVTLVEAAGVTTLVTKERQTGTSLGREIVENARAIPYQRLTDASIESELKTRSSSSDSNNQDDVWTVERGPTTYTISTTTCSVDDPKDGIGNHGSPDGTNTSGGFCSSPTPTSPPDDNPDDYKRVVAEVSWGQGDRRRINRQATLIANPGSSAGPQITSLSRSPADDPVTDDNVTSVRFTTVTSTPAATVRYLVDGAVKSTVVPDAGGTSSTFDWVIRGATADEYVVDGSYVIGAQAFDARGVPGAVRSLPVKLNRGRAAKPTGFAGGWNATRSIADFEWLASNEGDVIGYRVYRVAADGSAQLACSTDSATETTCSDINPPADTSSADYYLVARDRAADGQERDGFPSDPLTVTRTSNRPNPPATVQAMTTEGGTQLEWTPPSAAGGYAGDSILFYRVYRDGQALADRYDRTGRGDELSFVDADTGGVTHSYYVTAVDQNYSESEPVGPVSPP